MLEPCAVVLILVKDVHGTVFYKPESSGAVSRGPLGPLMARHDNIDVRQNDRRVVREIHHLATDGAIVAHTDRAVGT